jgi:N-dimethylarginine dimethylaminohydrolase
MILNIVDETSTLESLIVGIANSSGGTPKLEDVYDPKSREHILSGTYPSESALISELDCFVSKLIDYGIKVFRPDVLTNYNQIYSRDIGFVIENIFFKSNILPKRSREIDALKIILNSINPKSIITFPEDAHIEGGDVILHKNKIFVGAYIKSDYPDYITARTNLRGLKVLQDYFPNKEVVLLELNKSNTDPKKKCSAFGLLFSAYRNIICDNS